MFTNFTCNQVDLNMWVKYIEDERLECIWDGAWQYTFWIKRTDYSIRITIKICVVSNKIHDKTSNFEQSQPIRKTWLTWGFRFSNNKCINAALLYRVYVYICILHALYAIWFELPRDIVNTLPVARNIFIFVWLWYSVHYEMNNWLLSSYFQFSFLFEPLWCAFASFWLQNES